jgi:hypothetical protein
MIINNNNNNNNNKNYLKFLLFDLHTKTGKVV